MTKIDNSSMYRCSSNSTIKTVSSLNWLPNNKVLPISSSSHSRLGVSHNSRTSCKASRCNTKYKVGGSRWRAPARRDASLTKLMGRRHSSKNVVVSNLSLASNLGRGLEGMRLGTNRNENFDIHFKDARFGGIRVNDKNGPPIFIRSTDLQRALHRDIDMDTVTNKSQKGHERWSAKSNDEKSGSVLLKPSRRKSETKSAHD